MSFDISVIELLWTITAGHKVVIHQEERQNTQGHLDAKGIDFSFCFFSAKHSGGEAPYDLLIESAKFADEHGLEGVWLPERHFASFGNLYPNPAVAASAIASITKNIKLRSGSVVLPLNDPLRVAEDWSMIDNISKGRVELSFASGWHPNDFVLSPDTYENRHEILKTRLDEFKKLWRGETIERRNGVGHTIEVKTYPVPTTKQLPIWITAAGSIETFEYAGSIGANIYTHLLGQSMAELAEKINIYRQALKRNGYENTGKVAIMLHTFIGESKSQVKEIVKEPFKEYLGESINLISPVAKKHNLDLESHKEDILELAFERYFNQSGLFGSLQDCIEIVRQIKQIGVDEIACLLDFGVSQNQVMASLEKIIQLKEESNKVSATVTSDIAVKKAVAHENVIDLIEKHSVTHFQCTPSLFNLWFMQNEQLQVPESLNTLLIGGEYLPENMAQQIAHSQLKAYNMYGPTETCIWSSAADIKEHLNTIGFPMNNTSFRVVDKWGMEVPVGVPGELYIGGAGVALGYLNNSELTEERFVQFDGKRHYKTGDMVKRLPTGNLVFLGRNDGQIKLNGYRIELGEIDNVIQQCKFVEDCMTGLITEPERLVSLIVTRSEGEDLNSVEEDIRSQVESRLPHFMRPSSYQFIEQVPLTPNGKKDRNALSTLLVKEDMSTFVLPETPSENLIHDIWCKLLNQEAISIESNFFDLGGNSILAIRFINELANHSIQVQLTDLFHNPTIKAFAMLVGAISPSTIETGDDASEVEELVW